MKFKNINEALEYFNLGKLEKMYNTIHAYGRTSKRKQVWLPIIPEAKDQHKNLKFKSDNGEYLILENNISGRNQKERPKMITSYVITRNKETDECEYEYISQYCQVLFDISRKFTVHAKVPPFKKCCCKPATFETLVYDRNFVKTAQEAKQRADELWNELNKQEAGCVGN